MLLGHRTKLQKYNVPISNVQLAKRQVKQLSFSHGTSARSPNFVSRVADCSRLIAISSERVTNYRAKNEDKDEVCDINATSSSLQAQVAATLENDVLMASPKRRTVARSLQHARQKAITPGAGGTPMPPVPSDLKFAIPSAFADIQGAAKSNLWGF